MTDSSQPSRVIGYCTNVHAGADLVETRANLEKYAVEVKKRISPEAPLGIGLWLSSQTAWDLAESESPKEFALWLEEKGLRVFTLNGFPFGDFHQEVVKHDVYDPTWAEEERLDYTLDLVTLLGRFLGPEQEGSISTLPLGWRSDFEDPAKVKRAAKNLLEAVAFLEMFEDQTGTRIHLDLEPEPGCYLDRAEHVVSLFKDHLLPRGDEEKILRYLRVCHDICHSAVMFEDQASALAHYRSAGIKVGKVQVSSAVRVDFEELSELERQRALAELKEFREIRYLHQTNVVRPGESSPDFYEDLPLALGPFEKAGSPQGEWRVHFHVPIFQERLTTLGTTQGEILKGLALLAADPEVKHYEVETYAWGVLPEAHRAADLATGIAHEIQWLEEQLRPAP